MCTPLAIPGFRRFFRVGALLLLAVMAGALLAFWL